MDELVRGARDVGRGFRFLTAHPRLWGWVLGPAAVTLILMIAAVWGVVVLAAPLVDRVTGWMPGWLEGWGAALVWVIAIAALGLAALLVFVSVVGIVAGPFNELLSEKIEERVTGAPGPAFSLGGFLRGVVVGLAHGVRRLAGFVVGAIAVLALGLVPVIGTIAAAALGGWLAARAAAYDCYDAVLARRNLAYRDKLAYLRARRGRTLGLGGAVAALLIVPGVNLVALGLGAAGATLAALDETAAGASADDGRLVRP